MYAMWPPSVRIGCSRCVPSGSGASAGSVMTATLASEMLVRRAHPPGIRVFLAIPLDKTKLANDYFGGGALPPGAGGAHGGAALAAPARRRRRAVALFRRRRRQVGAADAREAVARGGQHGPHRLARRAGGRRVGERAFGAPAYEKFLGQKRDGRFLVDQAPQRWYRGSARALYADLQRLRRPHLDLRRQPRGGDDRAALVHGMARIGEDEFLACVKAAQTYEDVSDFFSTYQCFAGDVHAALAFLRRWIGHVLACVQGTFFVVARREYQCTGGSVFFPVVIDDVIPDVPHFRWLVATEKITFGVNFDRKFALDTAYRYNAVIAHIENPVSRTHRPTTTPPSTLNIGGRMNHATALLARYPPHARPPTHPARAGRDEDARAVLMHLVEIMRAPDDQPDAIKKLHRADGDHLLYTVAWIIQNPDLRSTQILAVFSPIQQCGKSTIYS